MFRIVVLNKLNPAGGTRGHHGQRSHTAGENRPEPLQEFGPLLQNGQVCSPVGVKDIVKSHPMECRSQFPGLTGSSGETKTFPNAHTHRRRRLYHHVLIGVIDRPKDTILMAGLLQSAYRANHDALTAIGTGLSLIHICLQCVPSIRRVKHLVLQIMCNSHWRVQPLPIFLKPGIHPAVPGGKERIVLSKLPLRKHKNQMCIRDRNKGLLQVYSGVEFSNFQKAEEEILAQLSACQKGEISPDELEAARRSVVGSLRTTLDAQGRLEEYWLNRAVSGTRFAPEELAEAVKAVSREDVVQEMCIRDSTMSSAASIMS